MKVNTVATKIVETVKARPYTVAYCTWVVGCFAFPITTVIASLLYTGWDLGYKAGGEIGADLDAALAKRAEELKAGGTAAEDAA